MKVNSSVKVGLCGLVSGIINGILGTGGGMLLIPLLLRYGSLNEEEIFPSSVCIMLPVCLTTLLTYGLPDKNLLNPALPYMLGSTLGGLFAWFFGKKIPVKWLHRGFGLLLLLGGVQKLW